MNHKRGRPKSQRAGCLMCKPWKRNGAKVNGSNGPRQARAARIDEREQRREAP